MLTTWIMSQDSCAFVFGSMSFCDKLAGGAAILIIQLFCPCAYVRFRLLLAVPNATNYGW